MNADTQAQATEPKAPPARSNIPADDVQRPVDYPTPELGNPDLEADFDTMLTEELAATEGDGDPEGSQVTEGRGAADEDEDGAIEDAGPASPAKPEPKAAAPKEERLVRRLQTAEAKVVELEQELRRAREATPKASLESTGDLLEDVMALARIHAGVKDDDDAGTQRALQELGKELIAEMAGDQGPEGLRARREARQARVRHAQVQRQIAELKAQNVAKDAELHRREGLQNVGSWVGGNASEDDYPYLHAGEDDVPTAVYDGLMVLQRDRGYRVTADNVNDALAYVCKCLDDDHRRRAERLERAKRTKGDAPSSGGKSASAPNQSSTETRGPQRNGAPGNGDRREDRPRNKTVTASGVGNRAAPPQQSHGDEDPFEAALREDLEERRRNATQRARRS